jgi:hypothetical protein
MSLRDIFSAGILAAVCVTGACGGGSPTGPPTPPPPPSPPPANVLPSIDGITAEGRRDGQPARFADVGDTLDVSATVRDTETSVDELVYQWTATTGTFSGTGRTTTWTAPASAATPITVTLTLRVVENYGHPGQPKIYSQEATSTLTIALHDSVKEVGDMSVRFLTEFSKPQTNADWQDVMKDFNRSRCPDPSEYDNERFSVENHIANFEMHTYDVGQASVRLNFGGRCDFNIAGDACASVPVRWDSTGPDGRGSTAGIDYLSAIYVPADRRWWLCSSRYIPDTSFGHVFYSR